MYNELFQIRYNSRCDSEFVLIHRVWCNVRVVDESGSSVDSLPHEKAEMTHCSFEVVTVDEEQKKDEPSDQEESRQRSLVPPDKCHVGKKLRSFSCTNWHIICSLSIKNHPQTGDRLA